MDKLRFGMTLFDGTIKINRLYYTANERDDNTFIIYFTLLHEIMHAVSLLSSGDDNYFLNTDEFNKYNNIKEWKWELFWDKIFIMLN